jgi:hypothetical protein
MTALQLIRAVAAGAAAWVGIGYGIVWIVEFWDTELVWASVVTAAGAALAVLHRDHA